MKQKGTRSAFLMPLVIIAVLFMGCPNGLVDPEDVTPDTVKYTVTYDGNGSTGGSVPTDSSSYEEGAAVTVLANTGNLAKTYHTFAGWNTASDGSGTTYLAGTPFTMGTADVTLYAVWPRNTHTISFDADGGSGTMESQTVAEGATVTLPANSFTRTGHSFTGWAESSGGSAAYVDGGSFTMGTADAALYAVWSRLGGYTITYDANGNTGGIAPSDGGEYYYGDEATVSGNVGTLIRVPEDGTAEAFKFGGWNTEAGGSGTDYAAGAALTITGNTILYAKWIAFSTGDTGPAGGLIFYDKGSFSDGWRYLEAASSDQSNAIPWGDLAANIGASTVSVGAGETNTTTIVSTLTWYTTSNCAAKLCDELEISYNGVTWDDWFLPSVNELAAMKDNLYSQGAGGFSSGSYWSSCEYLVIPLDYSNARCYGFTTGYSTSYLARGSDARVRAARAF